MKKILSVIIVCAIAVLFSACEIKPDYYSLVSEERSDVLIGETEDLSIRCYLGTREKPFIADGKKEFTYFAVIIKLTLKSGENGVSDGAKVTFKTDKEYSSIFSFHRESDEYVAVSYVSRLPDEATPVFIEMNGDKTQVKLASALKDLDFRPKKALDLAIAAVGDEYASAAKKGEMEINIRIILGDEIFYYVGLITEDKTEAFLIDKDLKKIVARKTISN